MLQEVNFDGLIGPTHHYGGLAIGNLASQANRQSVSRPREAALAGLAKMKQLHDCGLPQAVLPPHPRPHWRYLRAQGFSGSPAAILEQAARSRPDLLSIACSSSAMWTANAATVSPAADARDGRLHFTPANLIATAHRRLEAEFTTKLLRTLFADADRFDVHDPLPDDPGLADEGAANHTRLTLGTFRDAPPAPAVEIFAYGRDADSPAAPAPGRYPARQTLQAAQQVARQHQLDPRRTMFLQQHPAAVDAGVFHNDVIAVGNENVLLCHERAWVDQRRELSRLQRIFEEASAALCLIEIPDDQLTVAEAVETYLFNSQLITRADGGMLLVCPRGCRSHSRARNVIEAILSAANPIADVLYVDVEQSLRNGGGPACLRLRVLLHEADLACVRGRVRLTDGLYDQLTACVSKHYRSELTVADLADPGLAEEAAAAFAELYSLLELEELLTDALA